MQIALGPALMGSKGSGAPEVELAYLRAQELSREIGTFGQLFATSWGLWHYYFQRGQYERAKSLSEEIFDLARDQSDPAILLETHHAAWTTHSIIGELQTTLDHAEKGIALYDMEKHGDHAFIYGNHDPGMCAHQTAAAMNWFLGYSDRATEYADSAVSLARKLAHPFSLAIALCILARVMNYQRKPNLVIGPAEEMIELCSEQGFPVYLAEGRMLRGWAMAARGEAVEGIEEIESAFSDWLATGSRYRQSFYTFLLAQAYERAGQIDKSLETINEGIGYYEKQFSVRFGPIFYWIRGDLILQGGGSQKDAEAQFRRALNIAQGQGAKLPELRAATSLARLWHSQGKKDEARQLLSGIYDWFTEGFDAPDLVDAKALLEELS